MKPAVPVEDVEGVPHELSVMRHVGKYPRGTGEIPEVKAARRWQLDDPVSFKKELHRLEAALVAPVERPAVEGEPEREIAAGGPDLGTERAVSLLERLLAEWEEE